MPTLPDPAELDAIVQAALKAAHAPGAAVAIVCGEQIYTRGFGVREVGGENPVTPDTLFGCASTTKAFTAMALSLLIDQKKVAWDDKVSKHLPTFRLFDSLADANVTLRDITTHRTGLPRHDLLWYGSPWNPAEILRRTAFAPPSKGFRAAYQYQNIGFLAAGEAVRQVSGAASFPDFVQEKIFAPLQMTANFSVEQTQTAPDFAVPHRRKKNKTKPIPWRNMDNAHALGGLNASVSDLAKWLRFLLAGGVSESGTRLVSKKQLRECWTPQMILPRDKETRTLYPDTVQVSYGLGWSIRNYRGGHKLVSHGGAIDGFRANVAVLHDYGIGVAVLTNSAPSFLPEIVRNQIIDLLLDLPSHDWPEAFAKWQTKTEKQAKKQKRDKAARIKNTKPTRPLQAYAGTYENPAYGMARVSFAGNKLRLTWNQTDAPLKHFHFDTFTVRPPKDAPWEKQNVCFAINSGGFPASLSLFEQTFTKTQAWEAVK